MNLTIEVATWTYPSNTNPNHTEARAYRASVRDEWGAVVYETESYDNRADAREDAAQYVRNVREMARS